MKEQQNDIYSIYNKEDNSKKINNPSEEVPKRSILNKMILGMFYVGIIVIGYVTYGMYNDNKYEFYIQKPEVLLATNSNYQIELLPKNIENFDYKNYKYEVSNQDVVNVDETGKVQGVGIGESLIKIKSKNGRVEKTVKIKVEDLGNAQIDSKYDEGSISSKVLGRENLNLDLLYESSDPQVEVDEYGHVERPDGSGGLVYVYPPTGDPV